VINLLGELVIAGAGASLLARQAGQDTLAQARGNLGFQSARPHLALPQDVQGVPAFGAEGKRQTRYWIKPGAA